MTTVTIQQNVGGYTGTIDTYLREGKPTTQYTAAALVYADGADSSGVRIQGLLSFANIFGDGPGQIPLGSTITSATLTLMMSDGTSSPVSFYRMASDWTALSSLTWNSLGGGIQTDGTEALATADVSLSGLAGGLRTIDVAQSLQAWSGGAANYGWMLSSGGSDGFAFNSSEGAGAPILTVTYDAPVAPTPGLNVVQSGGSTAVTEGGAGDTLLISLRSGPTADVTITIWTAGAGDIGLVPIQMTFTALNWQTQQSVALSAINDAFFEGPEAFTVTITATSTDPGYNGLTADVPVTVTDNDAAPGLDVVQSGGSTVVTEGGAGDTLLISLRSAPTSDVTITIWTAGAGDIGLVPIQLTFTSLNWQTAQSVAFDAINDILVEGPEVFAGTVTAASADLGFNGLSFGYSVTVNDNDAAQGLSVVQSGGSTGVTEGGAGDTLLIALQSAPTADVTITIWTAGAGDVGILPTVLTFTALNWQTQQTVSLSAINDSLVEGPETFAGTVTAASTDAGYNGLLFNYSVTVTDNDSLPTVLNPAVVAVHDTTLYKAGDPSSVKGAGDPSGIAYVPGLDRLFIVDSEHDESPYNSPMNLFVTKTDGTYMGCFSLRAFTREPTGIAYNPLNGMLYITDDDARRIFIVDPNNPTVLVSSIDLAPYGITDAEDPKIDPVTGHIYMLNGAARRLIELTETGAFVSSTALGSAITDAEALAYDSVRDVFYVASGATRGKIFQVDHSGQILASFDLLNSYLNPLDGSKPKIKGLELAPSSDPNDGDRMSLYAVDYGRDQVLDGRMFEIDLYHGWLGV